MKQTLFLCGLLLSCTVGAAPLTRCLPLAGGTHHALRYRGDLTTDSHLRVLWDYFGDDARHHYVIEAAHRDGPASPAPGARYNCTVYR